MTRLELLMGLAVLGACEMPNPAFDERDTVGLDQTEGAEAADSKAELGDGDGDGDPSTTDDDDPTTAGDGDPTTTGDGDGDPTTTGDGDGDPTTTGDGDGDPTTTGDGDGDPITTGDGDGEPIEEMCGLVVGDDCQNCAATQCCQQGIEECFVPDTSCTCMLGCLDLGGAPMACQGECGASPAVVELVADFKPCMESKCGNLCG